MCGIAGAAWTTDAPPLSAETLRRMTDVLVHRGPDDAGHYFSHSGPESRLSAALGHRRLSIIDLVGGHQPLSNEDGTIWIVFNGEIYNDRALRPGLVAQGHRFATSSDTETIVHLYEQYGTDCLRYLRGMFALAIWDGRRQRLFLARDRVGKKPLFYRHESRRLLFGSELKALLQVPDAPRELNAEAVDLYMTYQYVPHPHCILQGYSKLPPAHFAVYDASGLQVSRYWQPPYAGDYDRAAVSVPDLADSARWTPAEWRQRLRDTLTDAVCIRLRSDVPLGAFLSGGIDSTIIAGLMQRQSGQPVHTFSIGFPVAAFDERHYARDAARHLGTEHHEYLVDPSALDMLPKLVWHYDEPFSDSSAIPTMYLSQVTRREVTVALSGDGGDELFAGYDRYQAVRLAGRFDLLPGFLRQMFAWRLWQRLPASPEQRSFRRRLKRFLAALGQTAEARYLRWIGIFDADQRQQLYTADFRARLQGCDSRRFIIDAYAACPDRDFVTRTTCADVLTYLPCDILNKVDVASMAYGLECRCPFLDQQVVELAARMPLSLKQNATRGKLILRDTFRDLLPASIQVRGKMGFGVPIDHWFREELKDLVHDTLLDSTARNRGLLQTATVRRLIEEHESQAWDHSYRLWNLICLELWCRTFLDPPAPPIGPADAVGSSCVARPATN